MLAFAIVLVIVAAVFQRYTLMRGAHGIDYSTRSSASTVEPDEPFEIITELSNGTRRFVPFISLREILPPDTLLLTTGIETRKTGTDTLYMHSRVYLMPRQKLVRRVRAALPKRGRYFLRGATINIGDFLGLDNTSQEFSHFVEIIVIPKAFPLDLASETLGGFLGDISVRRFIMEDPVLTLGFREYTAREPLKMISWTQSARKNELMVKKYDYTLEPSVTVLLNVQCSYSDEREALIEGCFSLTRTVCDMLEDRGIKYDFATNAFAAGAFSLWNNIGEGLGKKHYMTIMEGLGRATHEFAMPFDIVLSEAARRPQQGRSFIVVAPSREDTPAHALARLRDMSGGYIYPIYAREVSTWE